MDALFQHIYDEVNAFSSLPGFSGFHRRPDRVVIVLYLKYCDEDTKNPYSEVFGVAADILWAVLERLQLDPYPARETNEFYIYIGKQYGTLNDALRSLSHQWRLLQGKQYNTLKDVLKITPRKWRLLGLRAHHPTWDDLVAHLQPYEPPVEIQSPMSQPYVSPVVEGPLSAEWLDVCDDWLLF